MGRKTGLRRYPDRKTIYLVLFIFLASFAYLVYFFILSNKNIDITFRIVAILMFISSLLVGIVLILWSEYLRKEQITSSKNIINLRNMLLEILSVNNINSQAEILLKFLSKSFDFPKIEFRDISSESQQVIIAESNSQQEKLISKVTPKEITIHISKKDYIIQYFPLRELSETENFIFENSVRIAEKVMNDKVEIKEKEKELENKIESNERYKELYRFVSEIHEKWHEEEVYWKIVIEAKELFKAISATVLDVTGSQDTWHFASFKDTDQNALNLVQEKIQKGIGGEHIMSVVNSKSPIYINNAKSYPGWIVTNEKTQSWIGIPLLVEENVVAVINIDKDQINGFDSEDLELARAFSTNISMILHKNKLLDEFKNLSVTDPLTELYNRREFDERLQNEIKRAKRTKSHIVVMEIDLDKFKQVNDTFGHAEGDRLLKAFAHTLKESVRQSDILFRIGGDEFTVILPETNLHDAMEVANRIQKKTSSIKLKIDFKPSVSIGLAQYEGENFHEFFDKVDKALYKAKNNEEIKIVIA